MIVSHKYGWVLASLHVEICTSISKVHLSHLRVLAQWIIVHVGLEIVT